MAARGEVTHRAPVQLPAEARSPLRTMVGTTLEVLTERTRAAFRLSRWRRSFKDHVIICGFGTKGRAAATTLLRNGYRPDQVVAIDERPAAREEATSMGLTAVAEHAPAP
jgi:voltage-gated potassium channel